MTPIGLQQFCTACILMLLTGCTHLQPTPINPRTLATSPDPIYPATQPTPGDHFRTALVIVLENQDYDDAIANPLLKKWADRGALLGDFQALYHPSYHNYLALIAGQGFAAPGGKGDQQIDVPASIPTIGDELNSWRNYAENYPPKNCRHREGILCLDAGGGRYARRHVPFISFIRDRSAHPDWIVGVDPKDPDNAFFRDAQADALPQYAFYSPNLDDDGHDPVIDPVVGLKKGAVWLDGFLTRFSQTPAARNTLVIVTYDESRGHNDPNHIYAVLIGPMIRPGTVLAGPEHRYNHFNILRTIEDNFHVAPLAAADRAAKPIEGVWMEANGMTN
ncbi:MAG TPA: alkaline phosphatase family protein [Tepidisphaeraceae bacterium]|nr:alkaline phosphatase family protein [Tepidisphaeraceae bacterium]